MLRFSDARNFGRTLTGLTLIAGPLVLLLAQIITPDVDNDNKVTELADVAAHKGSYIFGNILFFFASLILLGASVGVIHLFRDRGVTLGQIAGGLLVVGSAATVGFYAYSSVEYEMVNQSGIDRNAMAAFLDKANEAASGLPIFLAFLVGIVIGLILLAIACWRRGVVPVWASVAIGVGGILSFFGESKGVSIAAFVLLAVGLGSLGLAALSMSDDDWEAPTARAEADVGPAPTAY